MPTTTMSRLARKDPVNIILRGVVNWQRRRGLNLPLTGVPAEGGSTHRINPYTCMKLRVGMSQDKVKAIFGAPPGDYSSEPRKNRVQGRGDGRPECPYAFHDALGGAGEQAFLYHLASASRCSR
jgi:hypothetical protein